jgi:hypothetical protein
MPTEAAATLRTKAELSRRLAATITEPEAVKVLLRIANELEAEAVNLERRAARA